MNLALSLMVGQLVFLLAIERTEPEVKKQWRHYAAGVYVCTAAGRYVCIIIQFRHLLYRVPYTFNMNKIYTSTVKELFFMMMTTTMTTTMMVMTTKRRKTAMVMEKVLTMKMTMTITMMTIIIVIVAMAMVMTMMMMTKTMSIPMTMMAMAMTMTIVIVVVLKYQHKSVSIGLNCWSQYDVCPSRPVCSNLGYLLFGKIN